MADAECGIFENVYLRMPGPFKTLFIHVNGTRNTKRVGFTKSLEKPNVHVKGVKGMGSRQIK